MTNNNEDKSEAKLRDLVSHEKLNLVEEEVPTWSISREDLGLSPLPPEVTPEVKLKDLVNHEKLNLVEEEVPVWSLSGQTNTDGGIFSTGGTNFSEVLSKAFEDMQKNNEEQKKKELKGMPETEFKEVTSNEPEKKIDWREALRRHFQTVESLPENTALDISFTGIPKAENEPISKLDPIVLYSMEPQSMGTASPETNNTSKEDLLQRIKNVNNNLSSENKNDNDNKPKLK